MIVNPFFFSFINSFPSINYSFTPVLKFIITFKKAFYSFNRFSLINSPRVFWRFRHRWITRCRTEITKALNLYMIKPKPDALRVVEATHCKIKKVKKPVSKYIIHIVDYGWGWMSYASCKWNNWVRWRRRIYRRQVQQVLLTGSNLIMPLVQQQCSKEG